MNNKFFTDDIPSEKDIKNIVNDNNSDTNANNNDDNNNKGKKHNVFEIVLGIVGICVLTFAIIELVKSDFFKKDENEKNPNYAEEDHHLEENPTEEIDPSLIIPEDVKETLNEYCNLVDLDGLYVSPKSINVDDDTYEMCTDFICMTTTKDEEKGITYYSKNCKATEKPYKKITKEELDIENLFVEACDNLDEDGNYDSIEPDTGTSVSCESYSCTVRYNGKTERRSCVN